MGYVPPPPPVILRPRRPFDGVWVGPLGNARWPEHLEAARRELAEYLGEPWPPRPTHLLSGMEFDFAPAVRAPTDNTRR